MGFAISCCADNCRELLYRLLATKRLQYHVIRYFCLKRIVLRRGLIALLSETPTRSRRNCGSKNALRPSHVIMTGNLKRENAINLPRDVLMLPSFVFDRPTSTNEMNINDSTKTTTTTTTTTILHFRDRWTCSITSTHPPYSISTLGSKP